MSVVEKCNCSANVTDLLEVTTCTTSARHILRHPGPYVCFNNENIFLSLFSTCAPLSFMIANAEPVRRLHGSFTGRESISVRATGGCIRGSTPTGSRSLFIRYERHPIRRTGGERTIESILKESLLDKCQRDTHKWSARRHEANQCICRFECCPLISSTQEDA